MHGARASIEFSDELQSAGSGSDEGIMICHKLHWAVFVLVLAPLTPQLFGVQDASTADDPRELIHLAEARYRAGHFAESADAYEVAIKAGAKSARVLYDAACSSTPTSCTGISSATCPTAPTRPPKP